MFRRLLMAVLIVVALASLSQDVQAASRCPPRCGVCDYLFGGYGHGPFGYGGGFVYAGYVPPCNYTQCGC
ncbi:MAG TPA: hypothetical protein VFE62_23110, partial [Gemmataceae bacterium]|nr:hypothetical protein [Gemmataceae bacterium]